MMKNPALAALELPPAFNESKQPLFFRATAEPPTAQLYRLLVLRPPELLLCHWSSLSANIIFHFSLLWVVCVAPRDDRYLIALCSRNFHSMLLLQKLAASVVVTWDMPVCSSGVSTTLVPAFPSSRSAASDSLSSAGYGCSCYWWRPREEQEEDFSTSKML